MTAYPNPFTQSITIHFNIPPEFDQHATVLEIYDNNGSFLLSNIGAATYTFDASTFMNGVYYARAQCGKFSAVQKILLVR